MEVTGLPEEVWVHVFHFLSTSDKLNIRSSCRFFKRLIDRPALWRNSTVRLEKISALKAHFWRTLSKRKINSVVVQKANMKEWTELVRQLPCLNSVTVHICDDSETVNSLRPLRNLKRLVLLRCQCPSLTSLAALQQLSHLTLCEVNCAPISNIINTVSQLTNLTSLHYHENKKPLSKFSMHHLLQSLPKLKHLSLKMRSNQHPLPSDYLCPAQRNCMVEDSPHLFPALIHLELLNYMDPILSAEALQGLIALRCLTVQYGSWIQEEKPCHLQKWLLTLPQLSELNISKGYRLGIYANSIPETVCHLSLKQVMAGRKDVRIIAQQLPNLMRLYLDLWYPERQNTIAEIPHAFPKLQSLTIRHHNVPEADFLGLAQLCSLKHLVILDPITDPNSALTSRTHKLHIKTNYRIRVIHSSGSKGQNSCFCA